MTGEMSDVFEALGINLEELEWQDLALCQGLDTNLFFDDYEEDEQVAKTVDQACFSCPVMKQCMTWAIDNAQTGVWGGVYLASGKPDKNKNAHKTNDDWDTVRSVISGG